MGVGCKIIPSREGGGLSGPTPALLKNVPGEQSRRPGLDFLPHSPKAGYLTSGS